MTAVRAKLPDVLTGGEPPELRLAIAKRAIANTAKDGGQAETEAIVAEALLSVGAPDYPEIRAEAHDQIAELRPDLSPTEIDALLPEPWSTPIPLTGARELPAFPVDALPPELAAWVREESRATQTPPDLAAMLALATIATAIHGRAVVRVVADWFEPLNIFTAIVLPPGSRKSAVFRAAVAPLEAYEMEQAERLASEIAHAHAAHRVAELRARNAEAAAAKARGRDRTVAEAAARDAVDAVREAAAAIPIAPRLVTADATQEAIAKLLAAHGGRIAVMDAEGCGPIALMLGRYARDGAAGVDVYLRGHAGDTIRVDRVGREPLIVRSPAITMALTVQPEVLRQLGERRDVRGLGLLARILWCVPASTVGRRDVSPDPVSTRARYQYVSCVRSLVDGAADLSEPIAIPLDAAAVAELTEYMRALEPRLGPAGDLASIADWAGKLAGAVARIAGLLHAAVRGGLGLVDGITDTAPPIRVETMRAAITIGEYLLAHARAALDSMGADPAIADASHVLGWLRGRREVTRRDMHRALEGRFRRAADLEPALAVLAERGWIRIAPADPRPGPGRKASPAIQTHPSLYARPTAPESVENVESVRNDPNPEVTV